ncbi:innexin inx2-like [Brevipalpus obovatus]|uniref:innexin inx2-like n=1 Tax=Brevipalpus obovatus TaxID=246614 RepID=UPI003D9E76A0
MSRYTRTALPLESWKTNFQSFRKFSTNLFPSKTNVRIDNLVITLHSVVTVQILLVGTMFISMKQYFGDPIECLTRDSDLKQQLIEHYCWLEGAFSLVERTSSVVSAYPGVRPPLRGAEELKAHHKYYQWVYFVLIIQAILFYLPKMMWRASESNRLRNLISTLSSRSVHELDEGDRIRVVQEVADNLSIANSYLNTVLFCEAFCFVHLILQFWFVNMFLGGSFVDLGWRWLQYANYGYRDDPLVRIFPRMVKCSFHRYGFSGTLEAKDALCFLPLNIVNEKIYTVLWFWFAGLFIFTAVHMVWEFLLFAIPPLRWFRMISLAPGTDKKFFRGMCRDPATWFLLRLIAGHVKPSFFRDLIKCVKKDHYDAEGRPLHVSQLGKALSQKLINRQPNGPMNAQSSGQSGKSILKSSTSYTKIDLSASAPEWGGDDDWTIPTETTQLTSDCDNGNETREDSTGDSGYRNGNDSWQTNTWPWPDSPGESNGKDDENSNNDKESEKDAPKADVPADSGWDNIWED